VVLAKPVKIEAVALPSGKGAVAGICYIQSSGGKLVLTLKESALSEDQRARLSAFLETLAQE
jgi:hypothetical protein